MATIKEVINVNDYSIVNLSVNVAVEVSKVVESGTNLVVTYKAYMQSANGAYWSNNAWDMWINSTQYTIKAGNTQSVGSTKYYTPEVTETIPYNGTNYQISVGISGLAWTNTTPAATLYFEITDDVIIKKPELNDIVSSNILPFSFTGTYSIKDKGNEEPTNKISISVNNDMSSGTEYDGLTYNFSSLIPNKNYYIQGNSTNSAGTTYTNILLVKTTFVKPGNPSNVILSVVGNSDPIPNANYTSNWTKGTEGSVATKGYLINCYRNDVVFTSENTTTTTSFDFQDNTGILQAGDEFKIGVKSYTTDWENTKHVSDEVLSNVITIVSDTYVYVSQNLSEFKKCKIFMSINGSDFNEMKKDKFNIIN